VTWLFAFLLTTVAHGLGAIWAVHEWQAFRRMHTWLAIRWGLLLLGLEWVDYITADRMSLGAAMPGSGLGLAIGLYIAIERNKIQKRIRKKRRKEQREADTRARSPGAPLPLVLDAPGEGRAHPGN
jgi:hypothetical protein